MSSGPAVAALTMALCGGLAFTACAQETMEGAATLTDCRTTDAEPTAVVGTCLLEFNGITLIDGPCSIDLHGNGSFHIHHCNVENLYFAYVTVMPDGTAKGYFNGMVPESHAHDALGTLRRDGACWQNETSKVCAWR